MASKKEIEHAVFRANIKAMLVFTATLVLIAAIYLTLT